MSIRTGSGGGELFLEAIPDLSADFMDYANDVSADVAGHIERHALFRAVEESAEARSRLTLARDLHDSVVQFWRVPPSALKRSNATSRPARIWSRSSII